MTVTTLRPFQLKDSGLLIHGETTLKTAGGHLEHRYPGTGEVQAAVALAGPADMEAAIESAQSARASWRQMRPDKRREILTRMSELFNANAEELSHLTTLENGTTPGTAAFGPAVLRDWFGYYAGWVDKIEGSTHPVFPVDGFAYTLLEPYGVVGVITTWNAPLLMLGMKVAAALAAGNCVVLKPHELTPFASLRVGELALEAGLPPGVLNVVPGGPEAGDRLVRHPGVGKVSFTGGPAVAKEVVKASHETLTPLTLELGGKSANLIFGDADLDSAVPFAVNFSVVVATGQACALGTRLLVEGSVYDEVLERIQAYLGFLKVGDPFAPDTVIGPMITEAACTRVVGVIDQAISAGAGRLVSGGHRLGGELASGYYLEPTVFADVDARSDLAQHEIFGPVLCVTRFDTDDEAIHVANATDYGLAAFVQTKDLTRAHKLAGALDAGNVWINGFPMLSPTLPFGGYRQSGYGREGGRAGLAEYLQTKSVFVAQP